MGFQAELKAAHDKACELWRDDRLINFLAKYKTDLYEALMDFVMDPNYETIEFLATTMLMDLPFRDGRITHSKFAPIMDHYDVIDDMRAVWLA